MDKQKRLKKHSAWTPIFNFFLKKRRRKISILRQKRKRVDGPLIPLKNCYQDCKEIIIVITQTTLVPEDRRCNYKKPSTRITNTSTVTVCKSCVVIKIKLRSNQYSKVASIHDSLFIPAMIFFYLNTSHTKMYQIRLLLKGLPLS